MNLLQEKVTKDHNANYPQEYFMTSMLFCKVSLISLSPIGIITMLSEQEDVEIREIEDVININTNIIIKTIDVRIMFPNGENYIVMKKIIRNYNQSSQLLFMLNEEELLRMSAAIVDAGLYPGTRLYVQNMLNRQYKKFKLHIHLAYPFYHCLNDPNILEKFPSLQRCKKALKID